MLSKLELSCLVTFDLIYVLFCHLVCNLEQLRKYGATKMNKACEPILEYIKMIHLKKYILFYSLVCLHVLFVNHC